MGKCVWILSMMVLLAACAPSGKSALPSGADNNGSDIGETTPDQPEVVPPGAGPGPVPLPIPPFDSLVDGPEKYNRPWTNPATSIVIDAYQGNSIDWNKMATDSRVVGVIHRSSIGLTVDTQYIARRNIAKGRGYLWGAYHLGRPGDPVEQAKFFLRTVEDDPETLLILDLEDTSSSSMMNIPNAIKFMEYVYQTTARIPVVYANHNVTKALNQSLAGNAIFAQARLWYARFRSEIPDFPRGIWQTYFLWQFSSEINCNTTGTCLYNVPGTAFDMDVNVFYGSREALASQWR